MTTLKIFQFACALTVLSIQLASAQEATYGDINWLTPRPEVMSRMKSIGFEVSRQTQDDVKFSGGKIFGADYNFFATFNQKGQLVCMFGASKVSYSDQALSYHNILSALKNKYGQAKHDDTPQNLRNLNIVGLIYQLSIMKIPVTSIKWVGENNTEVNLFFSPGFPEVFFGSLSSPPSDGFISIDYRDSTCIDIRSNLQPQRIITGSENF